MIKKILPIAIIFSILSITTAYGETVTVQAVPDSYGDGYNNVYGEKGAFERVFLFDGLNRARAYSLDINKSVSMDPNQTYGVTGYDKTFINNIKKIGYLANNFNNLGMAMSDVKSEAVARQLSIWSLSGGIEVSKIGEKNFPIMKRVEEIIALSKGNEYDFPGLSISLSAKDINKSDNILELYITNNGKALDGGNISLNFNNQESIVKISNLGIAKTEFALKNGNNTIDFKLNYELPAGAVLLPAVGGFVITVDRVKGVIDGSIVVNSEGKKLSTIDKIVTKPRKPAEKIYKSKAITSLQIASTINSNNYKIIDTVSSDKFEKRHIFDSINLQLAEELGSLGLLIDTKILIIGDEKERITEISEYLLLNKFKDVTLYKGDYDDLYKVLDKSSYYLNNSKNTLSDPSNDILSFEEEKLEIKKTATEESNLTLFFIGLILILLSITAAFLRIKSSQKA